MNKTLGVIVIMAKRPVLGKVKTRLAASVGKQMALDLYEMMLSKTFMIAEDSGKKVLVLATGEGDLELPSSFLLEEQVEADLGAKMLHGFQTAMERFPNEPIVMIGTDCYDLTIDELSNAFDVLTLNQLVFGPSEDGGYYLIGMNALHPEVFESMEWSVSSVMSETKIRMRQKGLVWGEVKTLNDMDTLADLKTSSLWNEVKTNIKA
jgi:rSAM/selenodomain-associated transferase 1